MLVSSARPCADGRGSACADGRGSARDSGCASARACGSACACGAASDRASARPLGRAGAQALEAWDVPHAEEPHRQSGNARPDPPALAFGQLITQHQKRDQRDRPPGSDQLSHQLVAGFERWRGWPVLAPHVRKLNLIIKPPSPPRPATATAAAATAATATAATATRHRDRRRRDRRDRDPPPRPPPPRPPPPRPPEQPRPPRPPPRPPPPPPLPTGPTSHVSWSAEAPRRREPGRCGEVMVYLRRARPGAKALRTSTRAAPVADLFALLTVCGMLGARYIVSKSNDAG